MGDMNQQPATDRAFEGRSQPTLGPVRLQIDELWLEGFPHVDRAAIATAVEQELTRLFTQRGAPPGLHYTRELPTLDVGRIELAPEASAAQMGSQIAQAVYRGLSR